MEVSTIFPKCMELAKDCRGNKLYKPQEVQSPIKTPGIRMLEKGRRNEPSRAEQDVTGGLGHEADDGGNRSAPSFAQPENKTHRILKVL